MVSWKISEERKELRMKNIQELNFLVSVLVLCAMGGTAMAGVEEGAKIFADKKCITCHSLGEQKGPAAQLGGPLDHVGGKHDAAWMKSYLSDPKSVLPEAKMPKQQLTEKEFDDLVAYLLSLQ
jgi:cytochrome c2